MLDHHPRGRGLGRLGRHPRTAWRRLFERELVPIPRHLRWFGKNRVSIVRFYGGRNRAYDPDNLVGGCKPLLDALRAHGYLEGDSPDLLELHVEQARNAATFLQISIDPILPADIERKHRDWCAAQKESPS